MRVVCLLGVLLAGCIAPDAECGWMPQEEARETAAAGNCMKLVASEADSHWAKEPSDGCSADSATQCLILMPGESGLGYTESSAGEVFGKFSSASFHAELIDGVCPLSCQ